MGQLRVCQRLFQIHGLKLFRSDSSLDDRLYANVVDGVVAPGINLQQVLMDQGG